MEAEEKMKRYRPSISADLMKTARQERAWAHTAKTEAMDEGKRASLWKKRGYNLFARELKWDSDIADAFYHMRLNRSNRYMRLAKTIRRHK